MKKLLLTLILLCAITSVYAIDESVYDQVIDNGTVIVPYGQAVPATTIVEATPINPVAYAEVRLEYELYNDTEYEYTNFSYMEDNVSKLGAYKVEKIVEKLREIQTQHLVYEDNILEADILNDAARFNRPDNYDLIQNLTNDQYFIGNRVYESLVVEEQQGNVSINVSYVVKYVANNEYGFELREISRWEEDYFLAETLDGNTEVYKQSIINILGLE